MSAEREALACTLSSAQIAIGRAIRASAWSQSAGKGCSISVTPLARRRRDFVSSSSGTQPSFGVDNELGPRCCTPYRCYPHGIARAAQLDLEQRAAGGFAAFSAIASGVANEIV